MALRTERLYRESQNVDTQPLTCRSFLARAIASDLLRFSLDFNALLKLRYVDQEQGNPTRVWWHTVTTCSGLLLVRTPQTLCQTTYTNGFRLELSFGCRTAIVPAEPAQKAHSCPRVMEEKSDWNQQYRRLWQNSPVHNLQRHLSSTQTLD